MVVHAAVLEPTPPDRYAAGACNIGPAEISRRRRSGHLGVALTVAVLAVLQALEAPSEARLLVALPATMAAIGYLQAHLRFCAAYGFLGVFNLGNLGRRDAVADPESQARDRRRALQIALGGLGIGLSVALAAVAL